MVLADAVQVSDQKLWILGGGWDRTEANQPAPQGLGILIHIPWDHTNTNIKLEVKLLNTDGVNVEFGEPPQPVRAGAEFEVGRPPGMKQGERLNFPLAFRFNGLVHEPGGYVWECQIDDELVARWPFRAV